MFHNRPKAEKPAPKAEKRAQALCPECKEQKPAWLRRNAVCCSERCRKRRQRRIAAEAAKVKYKRPKSKREKALSRR